MCKNFFFFFFAVMLRKVKNAMLQKNGNYFFEELSAYI